MAQTHNELSAYIPQNYVFDVAQIQEMDVKSKDFKELIVRLSQQINNLALGINARDTGLYDTQEFVTGGTYFPDPTLTSSSLGLVTPIQRPVYRKVINFGAMPGASTTKSVAHGITGLTSASFSITRIYGAATNPTTHIFVPLPYADPNAAANAVTLYANATNINITTGTYNWSGYTKTYIVLEYLKN